MGKAAWVTFLCRVSAGFTSVLAFLLSSPILCFNTNRFKIKLIESWPLNYTSAQSLAMFPPYKPLRKSHGFEIYSLYMRLGYRVCCSVKGSRVKALWFMWFVWPSSGLLETLPPGKLIRGQKMLLLTCKEKKKRNRENKTLERIKKKRFGNSSVRTKHLITTKITLEINTYIP